MRLSTSDDIAILNIIHILASGTQIDANQPLEFGMVILLQIT